MPTFDPSIIQKIHDQGYAVVEDFIREYRMRPNEFNEYVDSGLLVVRYFSLRTGNWVDASEYRSDSCGVALHAREIAKVVPKGLAKIANKLMLKLSEEDLAEGSDLEPLDLDEDAIEVEEPAADEEMVADVDVPMEPKRKARERKDDGLGSLRDRLREVLDVKSWNLYEFMMRVRAQGLEIPHQLSLSRFLSGFRLNENASAQLIRALDHLDGSPDPDVAMPIQDTPPKRRPRVPYLLLTEEEGGRIHIQGSCLRLGKFQIAEAETSPKEGEVISFRIVKDSLGNMAFELLSIEDS